MKGIALILFRQNGHLQKEELCMITKKLCVTVNIVLATLIILYIASNICVWFNTCVGGAINLLFP